MNLSNPQRIAFLFLMRGNHCQEAMWSEFLDSHEEEYTMHVHAKYPAQIQDGIWRKALIQCQANTSWGDISIVRATLALLQSAFRDVTNQHFVLISESCVPIKPFSVIRAILMGDVRGRMAWEHAKNVLLAARGRRMASAVNISPAHWIYHHQWIIFTRKMADALLKNDKTANFERVRVPDECYFGSVLASLNFDFESNIANHASTHTDWQRLRRVRSGPFVYSELNAADVETLRRSDCLFARKFTSDSNIREIGLHRS